MQIWNAHYFTAVKTHLLIVHYLQHAHKRGRVLIEGDSFHWGTLTVLTGQANLERSYEVVRSCLMFTLWMSLLGSYGSY